MESAKKYPTKKYDKAFLQELMEKLMTVRKFEEGIHSLYERGLIYGTAHLGIGEEATGIGTTSALKKDDYVFITHRGHGSAIGKGIDIKAMMAEMLAKDSGVNHGRGGSMHIADIDNGILGANGIVAANNPLACGAALTIKMQKIPDRVAVAFMGDGAFNEGATHEALNLAAVWNLPVMFVLTDNNYGVSTPINRASKETDFLKRAAAYGIKGYAVDGNDVLAVYETVKKARSFILKKSEPVLVVERTYRTSGHSKSDCNLYRSKEEIEKWEQKNPVRRFKEYLLKGGFFTNEELSLMDEKTTGIIADAVEYAKGCAAPSASDIEAAVYAL